MDKNIQKDSIWSKLDLKSFIPGLVILAIVILAGAIFPTEFNNALVGATDWIMEHFKWVYVLTVVVITFICLYIVIGKWGDIKLGGRHAKPSIKTSTWFTMSLTGTIAVGICFYGVSGPVNMFMNPPAFLGVEAGTAEAVIPTLEYCFLHYGLPPYFLITFFALVIALVYYNGKRTMRGSSTLYPLFGKKADGWIGNIVNTLIILSLMVCGTNMGLAVIQLNAGIGTVAGMAETPSFEMILIIFYTGLTILFAVSGVHKMMGKLSDLNALCYAIVLIFVLAVGPTNRLLGTFFTSVTQYIADFIPMIGFADPVLETGWQSSNTMFYFAWNIAPALLHALFYVSIAYGRTLREFIVVNCILPVGVVFLWYVTFGGSAMYSILEGSNLYALIQQYGDGIATFAFLDTLPLGTILKWFFLLLAIMTFITFSDGIAFSFPMMLLKETEEDASHTSVPKVMNIAVSLFMGALTMILLFVGGYDALNSMMVLLAFPAAILMLFVIVSFVKMVTNREKYDLTYRAELIEDGIRTAKDFAEYDKELEG